MQRGLVEQETMGQLTVLAERFTVVADEDDDRLLPIDRGQQTPYLSIDVGDLAVVRLRVRRRRCIRGVRIVEVDPGEERSGVAVLQPVQGTVDRVAAPSLRIVGRRAARVADHGIVVNVESTIETESMIEHERADKRTGA